jgi:mRNA interferase MazF
MFAPGDVIVLDFPGAQGVKVRPGIVVSTDDYHLVRPNLIVALCTSRIASANTAMDYVLNDWHRAGLKLPTAYRSYFTMCESRDVGRLADHEWTEVQSRLRLALATS